MELFDEDHRDDAVHTDVSVHTELERMRHEKEELEWQNHRLIERMAKLKFVLKSKNMSKLCKIPKHVKSKFLINLNHTH